MFFCIQSCLPGVLLYLTINARCPAIFNQSCQMSCYIQLFLTGIPLHSTFLYSPFPARCPAIFNHSARCPVKFNHSCYVSWCIQPFLAGVLLYSTIPTRWPVIFNHFCRVSCFIALLYVHAIIVRFVLECTLKNMAPSLKKTNRFYDRKKV